MILNRIVLTDFGLYRGVQEIDLSPRARRNIVLFGGKNGSGKTTLLEAIRLCFYGQSWSPDLGSRSRYEAYLNGRIHRNPEALLQPTSASIEIEFQLGEISGVHQYSVKRNWTAKAGGRLAEYFVVNKDGKILDEVSEEHWQDFIRDLIPAGISQLFFFDGEKIQQLAEDSTDQATLADSIKSLLGVDIIERLQSDLSIFRSRISRTSAPSKAETELRSLEEELRTLELAQTNLSQDLQRQRASANDVQTKINRVEERISSLGGNFARRREQLTSKRSELKAAIAKNEEIIRDLCAQVLPFCLVPELGSTLEISLRQEEAARDAAVIRKALEQAKEKIIARITGDGLSAMKALTSKQQKCLSQEFEQAVAESITVPPDNLVDAVHRLSPEQAQHLISVLEHAKSVVLPVKRASEELESAYRELQKVERDLKNAPADEVIKPLFQELSMLHQQKAEANLGALECDKRLKETEIRIEEKRRALSKLAEALAASETQAESIRSASKIQLTLDEFKNSLIEKRIEQLQRYLTEAFNQLCRKKDALRGALINPRDFSVVLLDRYGRPLHKSELSAGEKQIYAISILWALAKTSGRPLPMIIDTPLARLDGDHRRSLARHYFPFASQQTIILSTDTEIDQTFFEELQPNIARSYRLDFVEHENATSVCSGYFWSSPE